MSAPHIILDNLPSLCQKLSDLVEVWHSYDKNNCFFLRHGVLMSLGTQNGNLHVKSHHVMQKSACICSWFTNCVPYYLPIII